MFGRMTSGRAAFGGRTTHLDLCPRWIRRFCVLSWNFGVVALGLGEKDTLGSLVLGVCGFGIFEGGVRHPRGGQVVEAEKDKTWRGLVLCFGGGGGGGVVIPGSGGGGGGGGR